jgi:hypothetical protein
MVEEGEENYDGSQSGFQAKISIQDLPNIKESDTLDCDIQ